MESEMKPVLEALVTGRKTLSKSLKQRNLFELLFMVPFCLLFACQPFLTTVQGEVILYACKPVTYGELCNCTSRKVQCKSLTQSLTAVPVEIPPDTIELDVSHNTITKITKWNFANLESLQILNLQANRITDIEASSFYDLQSLREICISECVGNLPDLQILKDLSNNRLKVISDRWFQHLLSIAVINLENNDIEMIEKYAFLTLPASINSRVDIHVSHNEGIICSCDLVSMNEWLMKTNNINGLTPVYLHGVRCAKFGNRNLDNVTSSELSCNDRSYFQGQQMCAHCTTQVNRSTCDVKTPLTCSARQNVCYRIHDKTLSKGCHSKPYSCLLYERQNNQSCRTNLNNPALGRCYFCCAGNGCNNLKVVSAGHTCTDEVRCDQFSSCVFGKCQCHEFHYNNNGQCEQKIRPGETCNSSISDVTQCVQHAVCRSDTCECTEMYFNNNGKCDMCLKVGEFCNETLLNLQKCVINAVCLSDTCQCNDDHYNNAGVCDLRLKAGVQCNNNNTDSRQCTQHAFCHSRVCECDGNHYNNAGACESRIRAGESCNANITEDQCVKDAVCRTDKCECQKNLYNSQGVCSSPLSAGLSCDNNNTDVNQCVHNASCQSGTCTCHDSHFNQQGNCQPRLGAGHNCNMSIPDQNQCVENALCNSAGCTCTDAYYASKGVCHTRIHARLPCNQDNSDFKQCVQGAMCLKGVCECQNTYNNVNGACVQSQGTSSPAINKDTTIIVSTVVGGVVALIIIFITITKNGGRKLCCQVKLMQEDEVVVYRHFEEQREPCRISFASTSSIYDVIPGTPRVSRLNQESRQNQANEYITLISEQSDVPIRHDVTSTYDHMQCLSSSGLQLKTENSEYFNLTCPQDAVCSIPDLSIPTLMVRKPENTYHCMNSTSTENSNEELQSYPYTTVSSHDYLRNTNVAHGSRASSDYLQPTRVNFSGRVNSEYLQPKQVDLSGQASPQYLQPKQVDFSGRASPQYLQPKQVDFSGRESPEYLQPKQVDLSGRASPQYLQPKQVDLSGRASPEYLQPKQVYLSGRASPQYLQPKQVDLSGRASPQYLQPKQVDLSGRASPEYLQPKQVDLSGRASPEYLQPKQVDLSGRVSPEYLQPI